MSESIDQVKPKRGRPPKRPDGAMGGAARSKGYRERSAAKTLETLEDMRALATVLSLVVLATSERGAMDEKVQRIVDSNPRVAKYMHSVLTHSMDTIQNKKRLVKHLDSITSACVQLDFEDYLKAQAAQAAAG